jgi:hypothetical protein
MPVGVEGWCGLDMLIRWDKSDLARDIGEWYMVATRIVPAVFGILAWGSAMAGSETGDIRPDPTALIKDLETIGKLGDRMTLVLWLPTEFWRVTLESGGKVSPDDVERFTKAIASEVLPCRYRGTSGPAAGPSSPDR